MRGGRNLEGEAGQEAMWMYGVSGGAFLIEDPRESHVEVNEEVEVTGEAGQ